MINDITSIAIIAYPDQRAQNEVTDLGLHGLQSTDKSVSPHTVGYGMDEEHITRYIHDPSCMFILSWPV